MSSTFVTGLDHLVLTVTDIDQTCAFYDRALGLERIDYGAGRVALGFGAQKINLHAATALHPPVASRPVTGTADLCFLTPRAIGTVLRRLRDAGVAIVAGPIERTGATSPIVSVYFNDPDGNLIEVGAPADRIGSLHVRAAAEQDRGAIHALLTAAQLPLDGLEGAWRRLRVAVSGERVVAAAAIEVHDDAALLRSVVVDPMWRGRGVGEELVWRVLAAGRAEGLESAWLLTFVPDWFARLGFRAADRSGAPASMRASVEFTSACPDTAVAMRRSLVPARRSANDLALADADPQYPIGRFEYVGKALDAERALAIQSLAAMPALLRAALTGLDNRQLDTPVRRGGWTVRQTVHHIADSHLNAFIRLRWALTEEAPHIKAYEQEPWCELADNAHAPPEWSLELLDAVHRRMVFLLKSLDADAWQRTFTHPENGVQTIDELAQHYAWHGAHHTAQIRALRARRNW